VRDADRKVPLLFPDGIGYVELSVTLPSTVRFVVSSAVPAGASTPQPEPGDPIKIAEYDDPEIDPDYPEEKPLERLRLDRPWRVAESLKKVRNQIDARWPARRKDSDGTIGDQRHCHGGTPTTSDHCPWVIDGNFGVVTGLDITNDPQHGCDASAVAHRLIDSRDSRIKYVISNRQIAASYAVGSIPAWTWRPYNGSNPHDRHFHLSVLPTKSLYDSIQDWHF
jgi:hypothetical protein